MKIFNPKIITPFSASVFTEIRDHVRHIRKMFDAPGAVYHDINEPPERRMNRWYVHNLPLLQALHHDPEFLALAKSVFGQTVKPSYVFLSMYGKDGVVPLHKDRPQCQFTIDLQIESDGLWNIYVEGVPFTLTEGQALCYSGTYQEHYRKPMKDDSSATFMNLAFFHFVPANWVGGLN